MLVIVANAVDDNRPLNKPASTAPVTEIPAADTLPGVDMPVVTDNNPIVARPLTVNPPDDTFPVVIKLPTCAWPLTDKLLN